MLESFGTFIKTKQAPLVSQRAKMPIRHPSANPAPQAKARAQSGSLPKVKTALASAANAAKRVGGSITGITPRLRLYGLSSNSGGRNSNVLGGVKNSGRLSNLYRFNFK